MALFHWDESHAVYLPEVDAEHRNLFRVAAELHKTLLARTSAEKFRAVLRNLLAQTEAHLQHEERLMLALDYPSYEWHRRQHDTVRKHAKALARRIAAGDSDAPMLLLEFLAQWMRDHIGLADKMMASYLRNHQRQTCGKAS